MSRKMVLRLKDGAAPILTESAADDELQLQDIINRHPEVISIEELGMAGPMMVIGRETHLPSGAVDLIGITSNGHVLIVEFKTGPQNSDFRHALAQLIDYGSDLWGMSFEEFESTVAVRYFTSDRCPDMNLKGKSSIQEAAKAFWQDPAEGELSALEERVSEKLKIGAFDYVLIAQRFTSTALRSIEYLNSITKQARFYGVELIKFGGEGIEAFESRTIAGPTRQLPPSGPTNETEALQKVTDEIYRASVQQIFDACRSLGLRFEWGSVGTSIRAITSSGAPVSVAWWFPPGQLGWMGLTDLTMGFDPISTEKFPELLPSLEKYIREVESLGGVERAKPQWLKGYKLSPVSTIQSVNEIIATFATVSQSTCK